MRLVISILTMLCLLGVSSGRERERTLDEPIAATLTTAKHLPVIAAGRRDASSPLDAQLQVFTIVEAIELGDRDHVAALATERSVVQRPVTFVRRVSSRGPPRG